MTQIGIRKWGTKPASSNNFNSDLPQIPFYRLKEGINRMRLVTDPATYYQARYKSPSSTKSYGDRIRSAWPTYADECPVKNELGIEPKPRSMVIVIDRDDYSLKLFDMSILVEEQVENNLEVKNSLRSADNKITPRDFDIAVKFNPKSKKPTGFYTVVAGDVDPMNKEDLNLIKDVGGDDVLEQILVRQTACPKPETVRKRLEQMGWVPGIKVEPVNAGNLKDPDEDDYNFNPN